jgi:hypothetical protein
MKFIPWHEDKWLSREGTLIPFDKLEHFILGLLGVLLGVLLLGILPATMIIISVIVAVAWEIKDGIFSIGFSWKDLIADIAGIGIGYLITCIG